ncbi:hypothetical protein [Candidatus Palauibacter sp.]|uniref:hypothetical protein n=1 Tax=Candidatus Palauibacter sp. TaxID=3101350 RepID=UPI003AF2EA91
MNDTVICILPSAISIAARHYILAAAARRGRLAELNAGAVLRPNFAFFKKHSCSGILENGFDSAMELSPEAWRAFLRRIETLSRQHETVFGCVVVAGLGRGVSLDVSQLPQSSKLPVISLPDLHVFSSQEDASLLRLVKLAQHEDAMRTQGVTIVNMSGILNLFAFWEARGYALVPDDLHLPHPNTPLVIPHDCLRDVRIRERTNLDRHAVRAPSGTEEVVVVERLTPHATFPSEAHRPVYASREALLAGQLAGVVEGSSTTVWVLASSGGLPPLARDQAYRIWYALLKWLDRAREWLAPNTPQMEPFVVRVELQEPTRWAQQLSDGPDLEPVTPRASRHGAVVTLRVPPGFVRLLDRSDNDAERALLGSVVECLLSPAGGPNDAAQVRAAEIVQKVMPGRDAREIHLLRSRGPTDHLPEPPGPVPRLLQPEDVSLTRLGLGWKCLSPTPTGRIVRQEAAQKLLHGCVDALWRSIRRQLGTLDRRHVVSLSMGNIEAMWRERRQWRATARAVLALAPDEDSALGLVATREMQRTAAAVSFRVLSEMAASTAKPATGRPASWAQLDHLAARIGEIIELASHSDAIRGGLADPEVQVTPVGTVVVDRGYVEGLMRPYFRRRHDHAYLHDAAIYEEHRGSPKNDEGSTWLTEPFLAAFETEFSISIESLLQGAGSWRTR